MIEEAEGKLDLVAFHRSMTFEEERAWAYSKKDEWDLYAVTETAEKKGRAEGIAEGVEKRNVQIAQQMKADNLPIDIIVRYTGLTIEEIESL